MRYRRVRVHIEAEEEAVEAVRGDQPAEVYHPAFDVVVHLCDIGEWYEAWQLAKRVSRDDKQAGLLAHEIVKSLAIQAGKTNYAKLAADDAAMLLRQLLRGHS